MDKIPMLGCHRPSSRLKARIENSRAVGVFAILLVAVGLGAAACGGGGPDVGITKGRSLEIQVEKPVIVEKVVWTDSANQHRVIRAGATNRRLALVKVTIVNRKSTIIPLLIDRLDARIGDRKGEKIYALNPFEDETVLESPDRDENRYLPFLMDQVELERDFQVSGWMVFEVPLGLKLGTLWWNEVDDLSVDFR